MKVVVVIPTYNEHENTGRMIEVLAKVFAKIKHHRMHLLYVDGNSPDDTAEVVRSKQSKYKWLHLLVETKKEGLGMAYAKGMQYSIDKLDADYLMEFDGDFQHKPADIPRLVDQIDYGFDYVIGSRYIAGGSIPNEWSFDRKFLSVVGNWVARALLFIPHIHDVTGGFKLAKVKGYMDQFIWSSLLSKSFAYKIHLLFYMVNKGAKIEEIPIEFGNRTSGESKIIKNEMLETLRVIFRLQLQNPKLQQFAKFAITGFVGYIVNATFLNIFAKYNELLAWILSTEMAIISNFTINNLWTFRDDKIQGAQKIVFKFLQFNFTSSGALIIQSTLGFLLVTYLNFPRQLALPIIIALVILPYNYFMYTKVIWKKTGSSRQ